VAWDPASSQKELLHAIAALDRSRVAELCDELIAYVQSQAEPFALHPARRILSALRDHRHFVLLQRVADAFIQADRGDPVIRRQYAQALLDQGNLSAAVAVLERLVGDTEGQPHEHAEALGLLGRAFKQMYIAAQGGPAERRKRFLERAITQYREVYDESAEHRWHGINAVALLDRSRRDGIALDGVEDAGATAAVLAEAILDAIEALGDAADLWDQGTAVEACIALGRTEEALEWLDAYLTASMDEFSVGSTLRQLTEVWRLDPTTEPGVHLLPVLQAELLAREGGPALELGSKDLAATTRERVEAYPGYERVLGDQRFENLKWFTTAIERCRAAARIEHPLAGPVGTGFLVDGPSLNPRLPVVVLITNAHVIPKVVAPEKAEVTFRAIADSAQRYRVMRLLWSSPIEALDATIVQLDGWPAEASRCPIAAQRPQLDTKPPPRSFIIGHPSGTDQVMLSVSDNMLLDADETRVHYRTPTERGSSGSPVFDHEWNLIALHHAGLEDMPRLHGKPGTYPANEGIWIDNLIAALEQADLAP
jgi:tetratricopeptide (TPR) repeat protein